MIEIFLKWLYQRHNSDRENDPVIQGILYKLRSHNVRDPQYTLIIHILSSDI